MRQTWVLVLNGMEQVLGDVALKSLLGEILNVSNVNARSHLLGEGDRTAKAEVFLEVIRFVFQEVDSVPQCPVILGLLIVAIVVLAIVVLIIVVLSEFVTCVGGLLRYNMLQFSKGLLNGDSVGEGGKGGGGEIEWTEY